MGSVVMIGHDADQAERLTGELSRAGYEVIVTSSVMHGLTVARASMPALVITDLALEDGLGTDVIARLSRAGIPVMVTGTPDAEVEVLGMGAVAYLARPFCAHEFVERVALEIWKHQFAPSPSMLVLGDLRLDLQWGMLIDGEKEVRLSVKERDLLAVLIREAGRAISVQELGERVWEGKLSVESRMVAVCVSGLRRKLRVQGLDGYLRTVHGAGYVLQVREGRD
jgi:two-component system response regulator RegX3